jgi:hypothetical protein
MSFLVGTPSDQVPAVLATGQSRVSCIYFSMCTRHPEGRDIDYLKWHTFDHRPEQYRLASVRGSLRLASTAECRAVRAAADARDEPVDHVMTYFFADTGGLEGFTDLAVALKDAGRIPYLLPMVERGVLQLEGMVAAPRVKVGADVLPWWPVAGAYLLVERGEAEPSDIAGVTGVAGVWWGVTIPVESVGSNARPGLQVTYCFLDDDPLEMAHRLRPALEKRWADRAVEPLLAAPFYTVTGDNLGLHLP